MTLSKFSFNIPTTYTDGSMIPPTEALSYSVFVDTVNPPVKSFAVPATVAPAGGVLTATFAEIGFAPTNGTTYFAGATAADAAGSSALSSVISFTYTVPPSPPTGFTVG